MDVKIQKIKVKAHPDQDIIQNWSVVYTRIPKRHEKFNNLSMREKNAHRDPEHFMLKRMAEEIRTEMDRMIIEKIVDIYLKPAQSVRKIELDFTIAPEL